MTSLSSKNNSPTGRLFIISGPSQIGKDSVVRALWKDPSLKLKHIITYTTRAKRPGEKNGLTYNFLTANQFNQLINKGALLEWATVRQSYFGTPKQPVLKALQQGLNVILQIDVQGATQIKKILPNTVLIFITAESKKEIKRRIFASPKMTLAQKKSRWQEAINELKYQPEYKYTIVNRFNKLAETVKQTKDIIRSYLT